MIRPQTLRTKELYQQSVEKSHSSDRFYMYTNKTHSPHTDYTKVFYLLLRKTGKLPAEKLE